MIDLVGKVVKQAMYRQLDEEQPQLVLIFQDGTALEVQGYKRALGFTVRINGESQATE